MKQKERVAFPCLLEQVHIFSYTSSTVFECLRCVARQMLRLRGFSLILAFDAVGDYMDYMMSYIFWKLWLRAFLWPVFEGSLLDCCAFSDLLHELCSLRKFSWAVLMMLRGLQACFGTVAEIQNCKILFTLDSLSSALWETSQAWDAGSKLPNIEFYLCTTALWNQFSTIQYSSPPE